MFSRSRASARDHRVGVGRRAGRGRWFWRARIASTSFVSRRAGFDALDDLGEVVAAGREAGAEVVEDEPEAVRIRLLHDVVDQVEVDRLAVALERQQVLALARLAVGDLLELRRRLGARRARLGRARTRRTSRRSATAGGSGTRRRSRKSWNAGSSIRRTTTALPGSGPPSSSAGSSSPVTSTSATVADLGAGDPDLLARRPGSRRCRRSPGPRSVPSSPPAAVPATRTATAATSARAMTSDPPHGPGGTSSGSQSPSSDAVVEERVVGRARPAGVGLGRSRPGSG